MPLHEVARDGGIGEPAQVGREILGTGRLETDALADEDRAEHYGSSASACFSPQRFTIACSMPKWSRTRPTV